MLAAEVGRDLAGVRRHLAEDAVVAARHVVGVEHAAELTAPHELAHGVEGHEPVGIFEGERGVVAAVSDLVLASFAALGVLVVRRCRISQPAV